MLKKLPLKDVLTQILSDHTADPTFNPLEVSYNSTQLYTHQAVFDPFAYMYSSWFVCVSEIYQPTTAFFVNLWSSYVSETAAQLQRQLAAMNAEYDPLLNYDVTERAADAKKYGDDTSTVTPEGGTHTVQDVKVSGLDSSGFGSDSNHIETDVTPLQGTETETKRVRTGDQTAELDDLTLTGHETAEHALRKYGNIGVQTNAQILQIEVETRKIDLLKSYVKEFIDRYCYYVG